MVTGRYYFRISYVLDGAVVDCRTGWVFDKKDGRSVSEQALETARSDAKIVSKPIVGTPVSVYLTPHTTNQAQLFLGLGRTEGHGT